MTKRRIFFSHSPPLEPIGAVIPARSPGSSGKGEPRRAQETPRDPRESKKAESPGSQPAQRAQCPMSLRVAHRGKVDSFKRYKHSFYEHNVFREVSRESSNVGCEALHLAAKVMVFIN